MIAALSAFSLFRGSSREEPALYPAARDLLSTLTPRSPLDSRRVRAVLRLTSTTDRAWRASDILLWKITRVKSRSSSLLAG